MNNLNDYIRSHSADGSESFGLHRMSNLSKGNVPHLKYMADSITVGERRL